MVLKEKETLNISKCQGYLWYSNENNPKEVYYNTKCNLILNPDDKIFVVEGYLWDVDANISYSVKYFDGKYYFKKTNVGELKNIPEEKFVANSRLKGIEYLIFKRVWKSEKDELCNNYEVLKPGELVFCGMTTK